jgi:hypothetical protein
MSDVNTLTPVEVNEDDTEQGQKIDKPYGTLELITFGGKNTKLKGFQFWQKQYKTVSDAVNHISSLGKNGEEVAVGLINSAIAFSTRNKASNGAPAGTTDQETADIRKGLLERGEVVLISEEDAEKYIPGSRERYGLGYFTREYMAARKAFVENRNDETRKAFLAAKAAFDQAMLEDAEAQLQEAPVAQAA